MMKNKKEIGPVVRSKQGIYVITTKAEIGVGYFVKCPICGKELDIVATKLDVQKVTCDCNAIIAFVGKKSTPSPVVPEEKQEKASSSKKENEFLPTGKFDKKKDRRKGYFQWGIWPFRHTYMLKVGCNTIGRFDEDYPSDIQLKDKFVSRRSVEVEVNDLPAGFTFKLSVKKATNPVYVNGRECTEGKSSVYLNDGDIIVLGTTKLRFYLEDKK